MNTLVTNPKPGSPIGVRFWCHIVPPLSVDEASHGGNRCKKAPCEWRGHSYGHGSGELRAHSVFHDADALYANPRFVCVSGRTFRQARVRRPVPHPKTSACIALCTAVVIRAPQRASTTLVTESTLELALVVYLVKSHHELLEIRVVVIQCHTATLLHAHSKSTDACAGLSLQIQHQQQTGYGVRVPNFITANNEIDNQLTSNASTQYCAPASSQSSLGW